MAVITVHHAPNNPMIVIARTDLSLEAKGLYCILLTVRRNQDETDEQVIRRCCSEPDFAIQSAINQLIEKSLLREDFPVFDNDFEEEE